MNLKFNYFFDYGLIFNFVKLKKDDLEKLKIKLKRDI